MSLADLDCEIKHTDGSLPPSAEIEVYGQPVSG